MGYHIHDGRGNFIWILKNNGPFTVKSIYRHLENTILFLKMGLFKLLVL